MCESKSARLAAASLSMRTMLPLALLFGCTFTTSLRAQSREPAEGLLAKKQWVKFVIIFGRITAVNPRHSESTATFETPDSNRREHLSLQVEGGQPSLTYQVVNSDQQIFLRVQQGKQLSITMQRPASGEEVRFTQPAAGPVEFSVTVGESSTKVRATNLWHLLLTNRQLCGQHLLPLLACCDPAWQLSSKVEQIERCLFAAHANRLLPDISRLPELIDRLDAPTFRARQLADDEIREMGLTVVTYLDRLNPENLSSEQKSRIHAIRRQFVFGNHDTTQRAVIALVAEPRVWLDYLQDEDVEKRGTAVSRLATLLDQPIEFDLAADPEHRATQCEAIRQVVMGR